MKTLQDLKNEYAVEHGFLDWDQYCICIFGVHITDTLDNLFFKVAKEALENAAENFEYSHCYNIAELCDSAAHKKDILKETNIPKL